MGERSYGIALSPKIYSMMSDKLYTDRIGSVVREVCSNAWDAQKMKAISSGAPVEPFKVTLPTDLEPHFVVEDAGPGMPDEVAQDLYSTLGLSTKENSNDQIGAFGLGSKSPFAVTDTFTVENTYQGTTHFYMCFKAENGLPSLLKTGARNEGRPDGVKVVIPAPGYKYDDYKKALTRQLIVMEPKPVINNIETFEFIDPIKNCICEHGYILENAREFGLRTATAYARMGMVLYPIDGEQAGLGYSPLYRNFRNAALILEFPIGAVEPLPSREALTYDERTKKNIQSVYADFSKVYMRILKKQIEEVDNPLDGWKKVKDIEASMGLNLLQHEQIYVLGWPITDRHQPNVFPTFYHEWEEEETRYVSKPITEEHPSYDHSKKPEDQVKMTVPEKVMVPKKGYLPKYRIEEFDRYDTRLNIKRHAKGWETASLPQIADIEKGDDKYLFYNEENPKYRIPRLKSWLNKMSYHQTNFLVRIDPRFPGSKTDFSDFLSAIEQFKAGLTTHTQGQFQFLSDIPRPETARNATSNSQDEKDVVGVTLIRPGSNHERYFKWSALEADMEPTEDADGNTVDPKLPVENLFYVTATRDDLDSYKGCSTKDLETLCYMHGLGMLIVRKTGAKFVDRLKEYGIKELREFLAERMSDLEVPEDYRSQASAKLIEQHNYDWFNWTNFTQIVALVKHLKKRNIWTHPFLEKVAEVRRLVQEYTEPEDDSRLGLINYLKNKNLFGFFKDEEWAQSLEVDLTDDFKSQEEHFIQFYPGFRRLLKTTFRDEEDEVKIEYIKDYNTLKGVGVAVDYTEVLESSIINKENE